MTITFMALNTRKEIQHFSCYLSSLEACFNVVSSIAAQGNQLIEAVLIDGNRKTQLPVEIFDEQSFTKSIEQLEEQWKLILIKRVDYTQLLHRLTNQRIRLHLNNIFKFQEAVDLASQRLRRIEENISSKPHYISTIYQLERALERCQHNLIAEQTSFHKCRNLSVSATLI